MSVIDRESESGTAHLSGRHPHDASHASSASGQWSASGPRSASWSSLFAERNFTLFCVGNTISWIGMWAQRVAVGWLSWELSHSPTWVGLVSLAQFLPLVVLGPFFGVLLDRSDPRRYALTVNAVLTALAVLLYVVTALHALTIYSLFSLSVLVGIANSAYQPVRLVLVNEIAPAGRLAEVIAVNSILFNLTRTVGPALAGVAIASLGIASTFALNAISYLAIIAALAAVVLPPVAAVTTQRRGVVNEVVSGIQYAATHPGIRAVMLLGTVTSVLGRGAVELLPAIADGLYQRGSSGLATLTAVTGVGAIVGAGLLWMGGRKGSVSVMARQGAVALGLILAVLGLCSSYWMAIVVMMFFGVVIVLCSVGLQAVLQEAIDREYRGRVLGLWGMCNIAGPGLGGSLLGAIAQFTNLRAVIIASGLLCAALAALTVHYGQMRRSQRLD